MKHNPANAIQDVHYTDAHGGINPAISDSSTYTFKKAQDMADTFAGEKLDAFLYSRHSSPSTNQLCEALSAMENTEAAQVFASGMGAITSVILQLCKADDHIISSRTIYGGSYAFMKNFLPDFHIKTNFVDITDLKSVKAAIKPETKLLYCEAVSNPLLETADLEALKKIATENNLTFVVDNTFTPLVITPTDFGADVVVYSLTKFINGSSDTVGGAVCGTLDFVNSLKDVNNGAAMLLGQTLDSLRSASVLKNLRTLPIRMEKHSENALYLAEKFEKDGLKVVYPGLESHPSHDLMSSQINKEFGYSGLLTVDFGSIENANLIMEKMQDKNLGSLAVSLGFYRTLFSASGSSTSSEISPEEQSEMGLTEGLVRFSVGLDFDIKRTYQMMKSCIDEVMS
ncbi:aminotransferase class I/II-fold pyridoxal phosphate-dependent enzyme [Psychroflexus halocasei]|uniref:Methionine-gamma-lyase n=1 Tax=Psychroflexus halocasei TaxID=908615 RepID=A0A1H3YB64_9FLAO|nr:aminotransferase class I/II-fold pyridoxal phosphate-dependent enzyme [Psychroflexus halocasei]SEA08819.1 methionine-gamma-lyase [Psychroflexus halocasei]